MKFTVTQRIGRTILVMLLAAAIAALPGSVRFANAAQAAPAMVSAGQAAQDHQRHHHSTPTGGETQKTAHDGVCPAGCSPCFDFVVSDAIMLAYALSFDSALKPVRVATNLSSLMGSPPFRPPRS
jgi:type II secretory pathway pseudopilin PulG